MEGFKVFITSFFISCDVNFTSHCCHHRTLIYFSNPSKKIQLSHVGRASQSRFFNRTHCHRRWTKIATTTNPSTNENYHNFHQKSFLSRLTRRTLSFTLRLFGFFSFSLSWFMALKTIIRALRQWEKLCGVSLFVFGCRCRGKKEIEFVLSSNFHFDASRTTIDKPNDRRTKRCKCFFGELVIANCEFVDSMSCCGFCSLVPRDILY